VNPVDPPARLPGPPAALGRLGGALGWLAAAQGAWPPRPPRAVRSIDVTSGDGFAAGCAEADALADEGADALVLEASGDPAAAFVVLCALLDVEPVLAVGTAAGPGWAEQVVAVREGLRAARPHVGDPERLVAEPVLGRAAGLLAQSAVRRTPVVLGASPVLAAAALAAERLAPGARRWWLAGSKPAATVVGLALADLALEPLLDLGLAVPGGAALALDLLVRGTELAGD
jgi:nicotinate-nucleotide--dimethylbenzimidazole phosphoribosyltransferase